MAARRAEIERQQIEIQEQNSQLEAQNKATMLGVQALLRDRLVQGYKYYAAQKYANVDDRSNLEHVYVQYHKLGANGVMDDLREKFLALPLDPPQPAPQTQAAAQPVAVPVTTTIEGGNQNV